MEQYTRRFGATSTNIRTPTTPEINQGNNQLTIFDSAKNNGYTYEVSKAAADCSAEIIAVINAAGLTPGVALNQLLQAIGILYPAVVQATETVAGIGEIANAGERIAGVDNTKFLTPFGLKALFNSSILNATQSSIRLPINTGSFSEVIIKFGAASISNLGTTIVFSNPFPNQILLAGAFSRAAPSNTNSQRLYSLSETTSSVLFVNPRDTSNGYWFAIGN